MPQQDRENWLVHDHHRYDHRYDDALALAEVAAEDGAWDEALLLFTDLLEALALHMRVEDEVIQPVLERGTGDPEGELAELWEEHALLARLMEGAMTVASARDVDHLLEALVPLRRTLREHAHYEEEVLARFGAEALMRNRRAVLDALAAQVREGERPAV